ncbi:hypothetical protein M0R45_032041 [Rubus argutus]|uniref:Uncharacterized protein n=1 Tax=Rubus argutus TaxID=59490 RepID=A0AAW1WFR6_RUBAR
MHEEMIRNSESYKMLNLPYRVVATVCCALNDSAAKKYDREGWFPASETYRELVSCSNSTDRLPVKTIRNSIWERESFLPFKNKLAPERKGKQSKQ